jgi:hypothetical protein
MNKIEKNNAEENPFDVIFFTVVNILFFLTHLPGIQRITVHKTITVYKIKRSNLKKGDTNINPFSEENMRWNDNIFCALVPIVYFFSYLLYFILDGKDDLTVRYQLKIEHDNEI